MFKKRDLIIFAVIAAALGFFVVRQYFASKEVRALVQPENNQVIAIEVARLTKSNSDLRQGIVDLENRINNYQKSVTDQSSSTETLNRDLKHYQEINGMLPVSGRGIILRINKKLTQPQQVDLANTIRNIGVNGFSMNGDRIGINYHFGLDSSEYEIQVVGNPTLIRSALIRKGGFLDQLFPGGTEYSISENDNISLKTATPINFIYAQPAD
jgi:uncharacterized protein YlxW (UPF0749 family)